MKKLISLISLFAIVIVAVIFGISQTNISEDEQDTKAVKDTKVYTLQQALSDDKYTANVDVEEKSLTISERVLENFVQQDSTKLVLSEETEQNLINQMVEWELIKYDDLDFVKSFSHESTYRAYLTVSTGYTFYLDGKDNVLYISDDHIDQAYKIQNSGDFFAILDEIKKETPSKES